MVRNILYLNNNAKGNALLYLLATTVTRALHNITLRVPSFPSLVES